MGSYVWWAINQAAQRASSWVATHQAEASLIAVGLANPATRGFVMDVVRIVGKETVRSWWNITRGIGSSAATRSTKVSTLASYASRTGRLLAQNPGTVTAVGLVTLGVAYAETSEDVGGFASPASSGIGLSPTQTAGKGPIGRRLDRLFSLGL